MHLTQETDYGMRLVLALSRMDPGSVVTASEISESHHIPYRFLLRVIRKLKNAGIVASRQGVAGGYRLARPPVDITLLDVIEAIEGDIHITRCLQDVANCNAGYAPECGVHHALGDAQAKLVEALRAKNFADMRCCAGSKAPFQ